MSEREFEFLSSMSIFDDIYLLTSYLKKDKQDARRLDKILINEGYVVATNGKALGYIKKDSPYLSILEDGLYDVLVKTKKNIKIIKSEIDLRQYPSWNMLMPDLTSYRKLLIPGYMDIQELQFYLASKSICIDADLLPSKKAMGVFTKAYFQSAFLPIVLTTIFMNVIIMPMRYTDIDKNTTGTTKEDLLK